MSALLAYSKCGIQFVPNHSQSDARNYSERSLIELRQYDFDHFSLQAFDKGNKNAKIFEIRLRESDQHGFEKSGNQPDEIRHQNGTYRLWLNEDSHDAFYKELRKSFEQLRLVGQSSTDSSLSYRKSDSAYNNPDATASSKGDNNNSSTSVASPRDLLLNVHQLGKYIEEGDTTEAARLASQLALQGIRLQAKSSRETQNEKEFTIHVQLDGNEYGIDQYGARIPVDVFQSTTVRELRAAFEFAYKYPPTSQYFFVNGCLAHDNSTMKDLNVGPKSLFVLFLLTHPKTFKRNDGPWKCPTCKTNNHQNNLRCSACLAARTD